MVGTSELAVRAGAVRATAAAGWRRLILPIALALPVVGATAYVSAFDPSSPTGGHYGATCPVLAIFGIYCPGCGGTRAVHELTHGHVLAALDYDAWGIAFVTAVALIWAYWLVSRIRRRPMNGRVVAPVLFGLLALMPVFVVIRNLPFGQVLAP